MGLLDLLRERFDPRAPAVLLDGEGEVGPAALRQASHLALAPAESLCVREGEAWSRAGDGAWRRVEGDAWGLLRAMHARASGSRFPCALVAFVSYDAGRLVERLPSVAEEDAPLPWLLVFRFDEGWTQAAGEHSPSPSRSHSIRIGPVEPRTSPKDFEAMVVRAKEAIRAGEVFQVNLSHRLDCEVEADPLALYERLRAVNPAPFSAFLASGPLPWDDEGFFLLSSSPERLFSLRAGRLEARPIAGTRRRGEDAARDEALRAELRADPKEQAEHVMMVDLARNDLGRVASFGSVQVPDMLTVETYRTVHHLVSVVAADLASGRDWVDALRAMFPGGTITGAPKPRAMELIEEIEPVRRGAYTGSLGRVSAAGECDFNILIRTIVLRRGPAPGAWRAHLQVGAGIVQDSDPRREYEETLAKAKGLLLALGREEP